MYLLGDGQLRRLLQRMEAGDDACIFLPEFLGFAAHGGLVGGGSRQSEFIVQFFLPLVNKGGHRQHEKPLHHASGKQFFEH